MELPNAEKIVYNIHRREHHTFIPRLFAYDDKKSELIIERLDESLNSIDVWSSFSKLHSDQDKIILEDISREKVEGEKGIKERLEKAGVEKMEIK